MDVTTGVEIADGIVLEQMPANQNFLDKALTLSLSLKLFGTTRMVQSELVDTGADAEYMHVSKDILKSEALKKIRRGDWAFRALLETHCIPFPFVKDSLFLVAPKQLKWLKEKITEFNDARSILVDVFLAEYSIKKEEARQKLGQHYSEQDYPSISYVRTQFQVKTHFLNFGPERKIEEMDPDFFAEQADQFYNEMKQAAETSIQMIRVHFADLVNHAIDRLGSQEDGTRKKFRDSTINNIKEFFDIFETKNTILADNKLADLVEKAKKLLKGVDPEFLKGSDHQRDVLAAQFKKIKTMIDPLIVSKPKRQLRLD